MRPSPAARCGHAPRSRGTVSLRSPDPLAPPAIHPSYLEHEEDLRVAVEGVRIARKLVSTRALRAWADAELAPGPDALDLEAFARRNAQGFYHPVGTCRIGGVVDSELRVRGIEGLRVIDASVLPGTVRGHTNAITLAVAERGAALVRGTAGVARAEAALS